MSESTPPPWEHDPLSRFLFNAARNERVSALKFPDVYTLLQGLHTAFQAVTDNTANDQNELLLPTRFLMARAHAAFLAAVRLAMSGQVVEAYMARSPGAR